MPCGGGGSDGGGERVCERKGRPATRCRHHHTPPSPHEPAGATPTTALRPAALQWGAARGLGAARAALVSGAGIGHTTLSIKPRRSRDNAPPAHPCDASRSPVQGRRALASCLGRLQGVLRRQSQGCCQSITLRATRPTRVLRRMGGLLLSPRLARSLPTSRVCCRKGASARQKKPRSLRRPPKHPHARALDVLLPRKTSSHAVAWRAVCCRLEAHMHRAAC